MFTIKYRYYVAAKEQPADGPAFFDECESIHGPFEVISQYRENGYIVVTGQVGPDSLPMTFGPEKGTDPPTAGSPPRSPRPTLWVMNEQGATIAKYDL